MVAEFDFKVRALKLLELKRKMEAVRSTGTLDAGRLGRMARALEASILETKAVNLRMMDKILSDKEIELSAITAAPGTLNLAEYRSRLGEVREAFLKLKEERKAMESYTADDYVDYLRSRHQRNA